MIDRDEFEPNHEFEVKVRSVYAIQEPNPLFIDSLQKKLGERFQDLERSTKSRDIFSNLSAWRDKGRLLFSPLAWGVVAVVFLLFLIWGIKNLIPRNEPSINNQSTPLPSMKPTIVPTQAGDTEGVINLPVPAGMRVPWPEEAITSTNAGRVTELARWGMGMISGITWSPDGKTIAIASSTGMHLYDAATFEETKTIANDSSIGAAAFSPDETRLAAGINESSVMIWDIASGSELRTLDGYKNFITRVAFLPGGDVLVTKAYEEPVKIYDVNNGQELRTLGGLDVGDFAISSDGIMMATTSNSGSKTIKLWDIASGDELRTLSGHTDSVFTVAFSPDGNKLASASADKTIKLWDVAKGIELTSMTVDTGPVSMIYYSPDGAILASVDFSGKLQLWDLASGQEITTHYGDLQVGYMAFSPDGKTILAAVNTDNTIKLLDVSSGIELRTLDWQSSMISTVAVSAKGDIIASGSYFGPISLLKADNGQVLRTLTGHTGEVFGLAFSPDGALLASSSVDETVKLWEVTTGKEILTLAGLPGAGWASGTPCVAFSPDGKILAYGAEGGQIKLWDITNNQLLSALGGQLNSVNVELATGVAFSPDGKTLASVYSSHALSVALWDVGSGKELRTLTKPFSPSIYGPASILAFSPDGKNLAAGIGDNTVTLWDVASGNELRTLHSTGVSRVAYSHDGDILAFAGAERSITLWDTANGQQVTTLAGPASDLAFSPDGNVLVSGSWDGMIRLWGIAPENTVPAEVDQTPAPVEIESVPVATIQTVPEEVGLEKIPIPKLLSGEGLQSWWWSPRGSYFPYSQQGPIGEPGPDQASITLYFLDAETGEICQGIQETVTFTQTEWGPSPEGTGLFERTAWLDDNHLLYASLDGQLHSITPCSDSIDNLSASPPDTIISLRNDPDESSQILLRGKQAYWLFNPSTRQSVRLDLPAPEEGKEISLAWSEWDPKLISSRLEDRQGGLWIVLESIDTATGSTSPITEIQASPEMQNSYQMWAAIDRTSEDQISIEDSFNRTWLYNLNSQTIQLTNPYSDLFGIESLDMFQVSAYGAMCGTGKPGSHLMLETGMAEDGQYYIYHLETGAVDQYPLNPPLLVVYPCGEGGIVKSFMEASPANNTYKVILVDSGMEPYDLVAKGHSPSQNAWSIATILPGGQKVMFSSIAGISLVDLKSGETLNFWGLENSEKYQDFTAMLSPDGKSMVGFGSLKGAPGTVSQIQDVYWLRLEP